MTSSAKRELYRQRVAQGKCTFRQTCDSPAAPGGLTCAEHRQQRKATRHDYGGDHKEIIGRGQLCVSHGGRLTGKAAGFCHSCLLAERNARTERLRAEDYATIGLGGSWFAVDVDRDEDACAEYARRQVWRQGDGVL